MGYFYWLSVKNSNHLYTELSLGYPKDTKFYLDSKASFIDILSSIASFKLFLVAWLHEYCTFSDSSVVSFFTPSKMGYFYWLHVKNLNHLYRELGLGYRKDKKCYLDSKASFINILSSIILLHLSCFWLLGCRNVALFRTVLWLA